jgi:hypothetical protein
MANLNTVTLSVLGPVAQPVLLLVGETNNASCPVTTAGCSFNPTIVLVPSGGEAIPTMGSVAMIVMVLLFVGTAVFVLFRRVGA